MMISSKRIGAPHFKNQEPQISKKVHALAEKCKANMGNVIFAARRGELDAHFIQCLSILKERHLFTEKDERIVTQFLKFATETPCRHAPSLAPSRIQLRITLGTNPQKCEVSYALKY